MSRLTRYLVLVPLIAAGLLLGATSAQAERVKLFHPPHSPLTDTKVVNSAQQHIRRMDDKNRVTKNFVRYSSRKNSKLVGKLNAKRKQRNQFRASYLSAQLGQYRNDRINPIFRRYNGRVAAAKAEYRRDIRRINEKKESPRRKRAAKSRAAQSLQASLTAAARSRNLALDRANRLIAATKRANEELYRRISDRDKAQIKLVKTKLRAALSRLRSRLR
jgi:hypothetical protein